MSFLPAKEQKIKKTCFRVVQQKLMHIVFFPTVFFLFFPPQCFARVKCVHCSLWFTGHKTAHLLEKPLHNFESPQGMESFMVHKRGSTMSQ